MKYAGQAALNRQNRRKIEMKIALINENSQAAKNEMICSALKKVPADLCTGGNPCGCPAELRSS